MHVRMKVFGVSSVTARLSGVGFGCYVWLYGVLCGPIPVVGIASLSIGISCR